MMSKNTDNIQNAGKQPEGSAARELLEKIKNLTDDEISLVASAAMALFIIAPTIMAVMAMFVRKIDFTMNTYLEMIKSWVFPFACFISLLLYICVIIRLKLNGGSFFRAVFANPVIIIFAVMIVLIFISQWYNGLPHAIKGYCAAALGETFLMEMGYFVFILFAASQVKKEKYKQILIRGQVISSVILVIAAFILWHTQTESTFFYNWTPRFSSIFSNTNYYSYYLALTVPLAASAFLTEKQLAWKTVAGVSFAANTVALSIDNSMGGWVGAGAAMIFIIITRLILEKKINLQAIALLLVFCVCLYVPGHILGTFENSASELGKDITMIATGDKNVGMAGSSRIKIWLATIDIIKENKWLGIGYEGVAYDHYKGAPWNIRPHNEFLQYAIFHGIPVTILYFAGCLMIFIRALRKKKYLDGATLCCLTAAFGYLVSSFFGLTVFSTAVYLFIFLGMGYVSGGGTDRGTEPA